MPEEFEINNNDDFLIHHQQEMMEQEEIQAEMAEQHEEFHDLLADGEEVLIEQPIDKSSFYYNPKLSEKKIVLYGTDEVVKDIDTVFYFPSVGYFLKTDPRVQLDFCDKERIIVDEDFEKNKTIKYNRIYEDIDENGNFTNVSYTIRHFTYLLQQCIVCYDSRNKSFYVSIELTDNKIFKKHYKENLYSGEFHNKDAKLKAFVKNPKTKGIKFSLYTGAFFEYLKFNSLPTTYRKTFGKKYTFGLEIETISGFVPLYLGTKLFCSSVHDGSLRHKDDEQTYGTEYVTDVLKGDEGLRHVKMLCNELTRRCSVNRQCGVHSHIGGVTFNKENVILMYHLYQTIQDEIFSMLPKSRRVNEFCRKLKILNINIKNINPQNRMSKYYIDKYYDDIIYYLSATTGPTVMVNKKTNHPKGFKCNYDHSTARYCWVNFIPAVFDTRGNRIYTIEFRPMMGTTDYKKIKNWLLICFALVDIVENHKQFLYDSIKAPTLEEIINTCYPRYASILNSHISNRKNLFSTESIQVNAKMEEADYLDNDYDEDLTIKSL